MNFYLITLIKFAVLFFAFMTSLAYLQWIERKLLAHIQLRLGPQRVGPHGLLQPLADVIKLITKEDLIPSHVNKFFYVLAPMIAVSLALISIAVIPFGPEVEIFGQKTWLQMTDLKIGILFVLAVSSVGVYGVALGGWASNNKYSLIGGLRSSAQMISYELPMALAIAAPLLLVNTLSFREMVEAQAGFAFGVIPRWTLLQGPFPQIAGFIVFLIAAFAETNRVPFDLPEAENELVAGFHTEYSAMKFASFFMAEYANIVTVTCVGTVLFLGGWQPLFPAQYGSDFVPVILFALVGLLGFFHATQPLRFWDKYTFPLVGLLGFALAGLFLVPFLKPVLIPLFWFLSKAGILIFLFIWVRGTLPRFRYDQLMRFAWTFLFPLAVLNLLVTSLMVALFPEMSLDVILFLIFAFIAVASAISLVVQTHPISSALSLVGVMGAIAVLYLLLGAEFIAAAQMIVYAGAIMVLFVFVIMLLNAGAEQKTPGRSRIVKWFGIPLFAIFLGLISFIIQALLPRLNLREVKFGSFTAAGGAEIGRSLFTQYLLPFEVVSILILIAIIGAVVLARKEI